MATKQEIDSFISQIAPLIQKHARERGYKVASPIIAQACIESAFGTSKLSALHHNYFGLKCGSSWKGASVNMKTKEEYTPGTLTTIKDNFRAYSSMEDGVKGYFDFTSTKRYAKLKKAATPKEYLECIKAAGYATSSAYVTTNMNTIKKYNLTRYDTSDVAQEPQGEPKNGNPYPIPTGLIKMGTRGNSARWLQVALNSWSLDHNPPYLLKVDGIAGEKTIAALKDFQTRNSLTVDGIAGPATISALVNALHYI